VGIQVLGAFGLLFYSIHAFALSHAEVPAKGIPAPVAKASNPKDFLKGLQSASPEQRQLAYAAIAKLPRDGLREFRQLLSQDERKAWRNVAPFVVSDLGARRYATREAAHAAISALGCLTRPELETQGRNESVEISRRSARLLEDFTSRTLYSYEDLKKSWIERVKKSETVKHSAEIIAKIEDYRPKHGATTKQAYASAAKLAGIKVLTLEPKLEMEYGGSIYELFIQDETFAIGPALRFGSDPGSGERTPLRGFVTLYLHKTYSDDEAKGCGGPGVLPNGSIVNEMKGPEIRVIPKVFANPKKDGDYELEISAAYALGMSAYRPVAPSSTVIPFDLIEGYYSLPLSTESRGARLDYQALKKVPAPVKSTP
jgi:hypothetical protein